MEYSAYIEHRWEIAFVLELSILCVSKANYVDLLPSKTLSLVVFCNVGALFLFLLLFGCHSAM